MVVDDEMIFKRSGIPLSSSFKNQVRNFFYCRGKKRKNSYEKLSAGGFVLRNHSGYLRQKRALELLINGHWQNLQQFGISAKGRVNETAQSALEGAGAIAELLID